MSKHMTEAHITLLEHIEQEWLHLPKDTCMASLTTQVMTWCLVVLQTPSAFSINNHGHYISRQRM